MNYPQILINLALEVIFPIKCLGCGNFSSPKHPDYICEKCLKIIPIKKRFECIGCKSNSRLGQTCFNCKRVNHLDQLLIATDYNHSLVVKIIKTFKYRFVLNMIGPISLLLKKYVIWLSTNKKHNLNSDNPLIISVPLFYRRLNWRGFNQAELIAKSLADMLQAHCQPNILLRTKESKPQADISEKSERLKNPVNIFKLTENEFVKDKTIILTDDICTTGATLNECARILKEAGAKKVIGFVIARG